MKPPKNPNTPVNDPYGCDSPAMDCTGLIPSLPQSDSELESYAEVYHYPADIFKN